MIAINDTCVVAYCRIALRIIALQPRGAISAPLLGGTKFPPVQFLEAPYRNCTASYQ